MNRKPRFPLFYILMGVWVVLLAHDFLTMRQSVENVPYSQFLTYLNSKNVKEVAVGTERIEGTLKDAPKGHPRDFSTARMDDPELMKRLTGAGVTFAAVHESTFWRDVMSWVLPALVMVGFWWLLISRMQSSQRGFLNMGKSRARIFAEKDLKTRFGDVAGIDEVKRELQEVVQFLKDPVRFSRLGGRMPKGILLVGPPGTGKTLLARAVAGEANVPFFLINGSEFVELFVGLGAARVRDLFKTARESAPCIVFIDELDALGKARGISAITGSANDEKEQTLNQLLAEMDGFDVSQGIVILAATNRPEILDPALLRAGRFDRQVMVDKPDRKGREEILKVHLRKVRLATNVDPAVIASITTGFSGADLANLVNEAALVATRRGANAVEQSDFTEAVERLIAGVERRSRVLGPSEKRRVAYHEMGHAVVALALGEGEAVHKITIIPRGIGALGYTFRRPLEDRYLMSRHEIENKIAVLMGGRAAEMLVFHDISTGAADDLDKATEMARAMITRYGMSEKLGFVTFEREAAPVLGGTQSVRTSDIGEMTAQEIDDEVKKVMERALKAAQANLIRYRKIVEEGAALLLAHETLDEQRIKQLWASRATVPQLAMAQ